MSAPGRVDAVAIGASAGGLEALSMLLPALPAGMAAAVFVVLHIGRSQPSRLVDIYAPKCRVAVVEAEDKEPVATGTVYFAPPDYHLLVDRGPRLALSVDAPVHYSRPSIDVLFESAADVYAERLAGVVLSGSNHDGAAGLAAIHRAGGVAMVQRPDDALLPHMPLAALRRTPDAPHVLALPELVLMLRTLIGGTDHV